MAWRYTLNIPLWILGKDAEGESVAVSPRSGAKRVPCTRSGRALRLLNAAQRHAPGNALRSGSAPRAYCRPASLVGAAEHASGSPAVGAQVSPRPPAHR
jgi:hypothetical protein